MTMERPKCYLMCATGDGVVTLKLRLERPIVEEIGGNAAFRKSLYEFEVEYDPVSLHALCAIQYGQVYVFRALEKEDGEELAVCADFTGKIHSLSQEQNAYNYSIKITLRITPTTKTKITQERVNFMELTRYKPFERKAFSTLDGSMIYSSVYGCFDDGTERMKKELAEAKKNAIPHAKKILKNGDYMTVLWEDGTKTIVKRASDEPASDYAAFTASLGIKCFGSNSALKRIVASAEEQGKKKKKKNDNRS